MIPERAIFEKEFFNNWYSIGPYLYSKIMCDTPLLVFPTFVRAPRTLAPPPLRRSVI